jgi:hypothetical protein
MAEQNGPKFAQEWLALQGQYERYESGSLSIKLICIIVFAGGFVFGLSSMMAFAIVLIFWLQEGIFRTSQARLGERLLHIEACLNQELSVSQPFQLHTEWQKNRSGAIGLIVEYLKNSARPTVTFPYIVLLMLNFLGHWK